MTAGFLHVLVEKATGLKDDDLAGKSDPYVAFWVDGDKHAIQKTSTKGGTLEPVWNEELTILINNGKEVHVQLFDDDPLKDDKLGHATLHIDDLAKHTNWTPVTVPLKGGFFGLGKEGTLYLKVKFASG
ncbi:C2 domain-containing protein [Cladochytrium replicatum]|nr:C2 domain-containing protein [Cladochytrium replicatum]